MLKKKSVAPNKDFQDCQPTMELRVLRENDDFIKTLILEIFKGYIFFRENGNDSRFRCEFRRDLVGPNKDFKIVNQQWNTVYWRKSTNEPVRWFPVRHKGLENSKNLNYVRFSSLVTLWTGAICFVHKAVQTFLNMQLLQYIQGDSI
jgi:hypothetical protein